MHHSVYRWIASRLTDGHRMQRTLEVGSYNENGSIRDLFDGEYIGVDMRMGPGVDAVAHAHDLPFPDADFEIVVSTEMLEHDAQFWLSLPEMGRVLKPGGMLLLTMRGNGFPEHAFPSDYWRFMPNSAPVLVELAGCVVEDSQLDPEMPGLFIAGHRR